MKVLSLTPDELEQLIRTDPSMVILDVREPKELATFGRIHRSVNIELGQLTRKLKDISSLKDTPIAVVCQTGGRSADAAQILMKNGFRTVYNLREGVLGWLLRGKTVERNVAAE
jgi:rhodanese-related sulfurtransferase